MKEFVLTKTCFYYDYVYEIDNSILEKECLTAFEKGKLVSTDESSTLNEDLHIPKSKELKKLVSCYNELIEIPDLPDTLEYLSCGSNKLKIEC